MFKRAIVATLALAAGASAQLKILAPGGPDLWWGECPVAIFLLHFFPRSTLYLCFLIGRRVDCVMVKGEKDHQNSPFSLSLLT